MYTITLDTGTTNSRVTLWRDGLPIGKLSREVGVRDTAKDGHNRKLQSTLRELIRSLLEQHSIEISDVERILASGMITSNVGLVEIPHLVAPVSMSDLANAMVSRVIPEVADKEIWFAPGVKNRVSDVTLETCETMDMMRGEEVEAFGLLRRLNLQGPAVLILPGSHTKIVSIDEQGRITGCLTSIAGELISEITRNTLIANALEKSLASEFNQEYVLRGYETSLRTGLARTCFTVRILDQFTEASVNEKANFLLGAVLADDVKALHNSEAICAPPHANVIVAGKDILTQALVCILRHDGRCGQVAAVGGETTSDLAGFGLIRLAEGMSI
ncbi:2-dehydro-3-deoxygalactonokinase [Paenibacillus sp.]|uniref:2-dehydro-3-deoxygalactonokinase n=1 Tax=Paenibacillus sp. TaxID=58172 RepID=UPI002D25B53E|nr:2-dehydro-3-deoxygalactonokinase [Paenibacillus sp.]HZG85926.1 2-dehydro-3-deoxygalactonokinase [Paenibacillus sp.]